MSTTSGSASGSSCSDDVVVEQTRRGRARGSGRGRGRGKSVGGRGRGQKRKAEEEPVDKMEEIQKIMKTEVQNMEADELRATLCKAITLDPGLMLEILRPAERQPDQGYHPQPGPSSPDWCVCGRCRQMPTELEKKCCGKAHCASRLPNFDILILDKGVLALARLYRRDILVYDDDVDINRANRHQAYRQFILWSHGRLAAGDRRVIPSCCVWRIRDKFPDAFNQYTGFVPTRLG